MKWRTQYFGIISYEMAHPGIWFVSISYGMAFLGNCLKLFPMRKQNENNKLRA